VGSRLRKLPDKVDGPLWEHVARIATDLAGQGYAQNTIHSQLWLVARLSRWMAKEGLILAELTRATLQRSEKYRWDRGGLRRKCSLAPIVRLRFRDLSDQLSDGWTAPEPRSRSERRAAHRCLWPLLHVSRLYLPKTCPAGAVRQSASGAGATAAGFTMLELCREPDRARCPAGIYELAK
jgi:hypothetical protein